MVTLKRGQFMIKGVSSETFKTVIQDRPNLTMPRRRRSFTAPMGYDGDMIFDDQSYASTDLRLNLLTTGINEGDAEKNREELVFMFDSSGYVEFIPYWAPDKIYYVTIDGNMTFTNKFWYDGAIVTKLDLVCQPWKKLIDGKEPQLIPSSGFKLYNPTRHTSEPLIKIEGSGEVKLYINAREFRIKNISNGHLFIDSEAFNTYRENNRVKYNENHNVLTRYYPYLDSKDNTITWEDNVTKVTITPRWRTLI